LIAFWFFLNNIHLRRNYAKRNGYSISLRQAASVVWGESDQQTKSAVINWSIIIVLIGVVFAVLAYRAFAFLPTLPSWIADHLVRTVSGG
jgi:hypothetical protein